MKWPHERAHFRIEYPTAARPRLLIQDVLHEVLDLSEQGIRWRVSDAVRPVPGDTISGVIRFRRGDTVSVRGVVLRVNGDEASAHLAEGVPYKVILDEQRFLRERFRGMAW
jgi:hypothetical protein